MLLQIANGLLCGFAGLLSLPITVFAIEVAAAVLGRRTTSVESPARPALTVLIPAHNEESGIADTLRSIIPQLAAGDRVVVVADNCTDKTRAVAEAEGAHVLSRTNLERRGKGFALDFGLQYLKLAAPEIVIIVDADCHVAAGAIDRLARVCASHGRPVQAQYLMQNQANARLKMRIAEFAWLVKNLVRPAGLAQLGLPCQLMGSGMAFPWTSISRLNLADGHIVEDMKMGLDLARLGVPPMFCREALVLSSFPTHRDGIKSQRTRWEHGHLGTILGEAPQMLLQGVKGLDLPLIALAADLCIPPLALLVLLTAALWLIAAILYVTTSFLAPLLLSSLAAGVFGVAVLTAWASHGQKIVSLPDLLSACLYPLWKIPMYGRFVFSRQSEWVRSKRDKDL